MNYLSHETDAETPEELYALATELKALWHRILHGLERPDDPALQRQQYWVLMALSSGPRRMSDLAECAQTSQASLTGIVDRLEEQGFVARSRSAEDRRVVDVAVTKQGRVVLKQSMDALASSIGRLVEPLDAGERSEFLRLVRKMRPE